MKHIGKRIILVAFTALLAIVLGGCSTNDGNPSATTAALRWDTIGASEASERLRASDDHVLVDVRTREEFEAGHIPGALNIPFESIVAGIGERNVAKDTQIFVYCRSGNRSATAARSLAQAGYVSVVDFGGIIDWPYEIVQGDGTGDMPLA